MEREPHHARRPLGAMIALAVPSALAAQLATANITGRVVQKGTTTGIVGAEVVLQANGQRVLADSTGRYVFLGVSAGPQRFLVRALGFRPVDVSVTLRDGGQTLEDVELEVASNGDAQPLAPVAVEGRATVVSYRLVDFERRRRTGRGHYLTDEEIKRSGASTLQGLTRGMRGVTEHCAGSGCRIQMVRAREGCEPDYIVDGRVDDLFGSATPIRDIVALEVYTGPSDVPGEFAGRSAGCGVIVIWTRAGPPRTKR
jgi:carboxypeptidase family protein